MKDNFFFGQFQELYEIEVFVFAVVILFSFLSKIFPCGEYGISFKLFGLSIKNTHEI